MPPAPPARRPSRLAFSQTRLWASLRVNPITAFNVQLDPRPSRWPPFAPPITTATTPLVLPAPSLPRHGVRRHARTPDRPVRRKRYSWASDRSPVVPGCMGLRFDLPALCRGPPAAPSMASVKSEQSAHSVSSTRSAHSARSARPPRSVRSTRSTRSRQAARRLRAHTAALRAAARNKPLPSLPHAPTHPPLPAAAGSTQPHAPVRICVRTNGATHAPGGAVLIAEFLNASLQPYVSIEFPAAAAAGLPSTTQSQHRTASGAPALQTQPQPPICQEQVRHPPRRRASDNPPMPTLDQSPSRAMSSLPSREKLALPTHEPAEDGQRHKASSGAPPTSSDWDEVGAQIMHATKLTRSTIQVAHPPHVRPSSLPGSKPETPARKSAPCDAAEGSRSAAGAVADLDQPTGSSRASSSTPRASLHQRSGTHPGSSSSQSGLLSVHARVASAPEASGHALESLEVLDSQGGDIPLRALGNPDTVLGRILSLTRSKRTGSAAGLSPQHPEPTLGASEEDVTMIASPRSHPLTGLSSADPVMSHGAHNRTLSAESSKTAVWPNTHSLSVSTSSSQTSMPDAPARNEPARASPQKLPSDSGLHALPRISSKDTKGKRAEGAPDPQNIPEESGPAGLHVPPPSQHRDGESDDPWSEGGSVRTLRPPTRIACSSDLPSTPLSAEARAESQRHRNNVSDSSAVSALLSLLDRQTSAVDAMQAAYAEAHTVQSEDLRQAEKALSSAQAQIGLLTAELGDVREDAAAQAVQLQGELEQARADAVQARSEALEAKARLHEAQHETKRLTMLTQEAQDEVIVLRLRLGSSEDDLESEPYVQESVHQPSGRAHSSSKQQLEAQRHRAALADQLARLQEEHRAEITRMKAQHAAELAQARHEFGGRPRSSWLPFRSPSAYPAALAAAPPMEQRATGGPQESSAPDSPPRRAPAVPISVSGQASSSQSSPSSYRGSTPSPSCLSASRRARSKQSFLLDSPSSPARRVPLPSLNRTATITGDSSSAVSCGLSVPAPTEVAAPVSTAAAAATVAASLHAQYEYEHEHEHEQSLPPRLHLTAPSRRSSPHVGDASLSRTSSLDLVAGSPWAGAEAEADVEAGAGAGADADAEAESEARASFFSTRSPPVSPQRFPTSPSPELDPHEMQ